MLALGQNALTSENNVRGWLSLLNKSRRSECVCARQSAPTPESERFPQLTSADVPSKGRKQQGWFHPGLLEHHQRSWSELMPIALECGCYLLVNWEDTQASPHLRLVNMNLRAFVHCSSELNWILKKRTTENLLHSFIKEIKANWKELKCQVCETFEPKQAYLIE